MFKTLFKDGLSIDETRVSALVVGFIAIIGVTLYSYLKKGDFTDNMLQLNSIIIYSIAGVNVAVSAGGLLSKMMDRNKLINQSTSQINDETINQESNKTGENSI